MEEEEEEDPAATLTSCQSLFHVLVLSTVFLLSSTSWKTVRERSQGGSSAEAAQRMADSTTRSL